MFTTILAQVEAGETMVISLTPQMLTVIPLLAMALQVLKGLEPLAKLKPWFPLIAVGAAMALAVVLKMGAELPDQLMAGVVMGLATAGGYDASRIAAKLGGTTAAGPNT